MNNSSTANASVDDIINKDVLELMGAQNMPEAQKNELYNQMLRTIQNRVIAKVGEMLDEKDMDEWDKLAKESDPAKANQFLESKSIDVEQLMLQESLAYKAQMVAMSQPIRDAATHSNQS